MSRIAGLDITIHSRVYKTVEGHDISTDVIIPKQPSETPRPVVVFFHGGGLVNGARDFSDWYPRWLLLYCLQISAVFVTPDYRLLPEAKGTDILEDLRDFFSWMQNDLAAVVNAAPGGGDIDFRKLISTGGSAGGYLALQLGLMYPDSVRAVISAYPMIDMRSPHWTSDYPKPFEGNPIPPSSYIDEYRARVKSGELPRIITNAPVTIYPKRGGVFDASVRYGRWSEMLGPDTDPPTLHPEDRVAAGAVLPPTWIFQGTDDEITPQEGAEKFVKLVRDKQGPTAVLYSPVKDEHHGFDGETPLETPWLQEGLAFVEKNGWLR